MNGVVATAEQPVGSVLIEPSRHQSRGRLPFLDGIRAFAVIAVLLYHAGVPGVDGGLLGVDVFFVLSGFLITTLLCEERLVQGTIHLGSFWAGRARRLLPALFVLLIGVAAYAWVFRNSVSVSSIRGDSIATLLYVANWRFVFSAQGYFMQSMTPSPLLHMWSLGVEEQYYLVWPLFALCVLRHRRPQCLAWVAGAGAAGSACLMASMYLAGFSTSRLYYGTDTRAQALLVGSVLGALGSQREWRVVSPEWARTSRGRLMGAVLGTVGVGSLFWAWHDLNGQGAFLYEGGFLLVALAAGAVITTVTSWRTSVFARLLSLRPIRYIGRISYGLYVYHWPLFLAIDHAHTDLSGPGLLAARLATTFAAAVVSFHLVEQPIRLGRLARGWRGLTFAGGGALVTAGLVVAATIPTAAAAIPKGSAQSPTGLSATERRALTGAHAFTSNPVRFLLVGDSVAVTGGIGLSANAVAHFGVKVDNKADLGCDLDNLSRVGGVIYKTPPGVNCGSWRSLWRETIAEHPATVVGVLLGRFEVADHLYRGHWRHVGQQGWDKHLTLELNQAIRILTARGAHVVFFTFPYIAPPVEQPNGAPFPENLPSRMDAWNELLRGVALAHPKKVTLVDLNRTLDPPRPLHKYHRWCHGALARRDSHHDCWGGVAPVEDPA